MVIIVIVVSAPMGPGCLMWVLPWLKAVLMGRF